MSLFRRSRGPTDGGATPGERLDRPVHLSLPPLSDEADEFLTACNEEYNAKQQELFEKFLPDYDRWDTDLEQGIVMVHVAGRPQARV